MKRAAALIALFAVGLILGLQGFVGNALSWYSTSTQTETTGTTETTTTDTVTATVLCPGLPGGLPPNPPGGQNGHPGNDVCKQDEITPPETTAPPVLTTVPPATETVTQTESTPSETVTEETTQTVTETTSPPPVGTPAKPRKPHVKPPCSNGTPRVNGRCHPIVRGSG